MAKGPLVTKFDVGDMVAMIIVPGCGSESCAQCSAGVPQMCQRSARYGGGQDGFYAPFAKVSERSAARLPPEVSTAAGAVATDACMTAYHAVMNRARVRKNEVVLVIGLGGLGFNGIQIALHQGARVVVFDTRPMVLEEAKKIGILPEDVIPHDTADIGAWLGQKGMVIDTVIDFVGMPDTFRAAVDCGKFEICLSHDVSDEVRSSNRWNYRHCGLTITRVEFLVSTSCPEADHYHGKLRRDTIGPYCMSQSDRRRSSCPSSQTSRHERPSADSRGSACWQDPGQSCIGAGSRRGIA